MDMFVARLLMICQCGSFKVGLALGCLPFVFLILGKVFFKNFAIKSKPVNIAIKWATALILAAAVCVLGTLGRFAGNTCGTCLNSELANSTFISFGDLLFSTASFGFILSISNLARAINPLLSNWILGVIFPLVVAAFSVMPLWTCLIVSHVQEVLYQANNDLNQSKTSRLSAELGEIFSELEHPGAYPPLIIPCPLTAYVEEGIDQKIVRLIAALYVQNQSSLGRDFFKRLLALNKGSDRAKIESLKYELAFDIGDRNFQQSLPIFEEVIANYNLSGMTEQGIQNAGRLSQSIDYAVKGYINLRQLDKGKRLVNLLLSRYDNGIAKDDYNKPLYKSMLVKLLVTDAGNAGSDDLAQAEMMLTENVEYYKSHDDKYMIQQSMFELGDFYLKSKQPGKAIGLFLDLNEGIRDSLKKANSPRDGNYLLDLRRSLLDLGRSYESGGDFASAERVYQETLEEVRLCHKTNQYEEVSVYELYVPLLERLGRTDEATNMRKKAIAIASAGRFYTSLKK